MSLNVLLGLTLLCWFAALGIAEALDPPKSPDKTADSNARWGTNLALTVIVLIVGSALPLARFFAAFLDSQFGLGLSKFMDLTWLPVFVLLLLFDSLAAYWIHRLMHAVPLFWRVHRVHHSDALVDVSTSLRNHPLELILTIPSTALVVVLLGPPISVVAAVQTVSVASTIWQHADIKLPDWLDRLLIHVIMTPRLHRLHHSPKREVHDTNFGDSLAIWDRLFGTLKLAEGREAVGLIAYSPSADGLIAQLLSPFSGRQGRRVFK